MNKQPNIKKKKQTWPTKDVMEKVCEKKYVVEERLSFTLEMVRMIQY